MHGSEGAPAQQCTGATRLITGAENKSAIGTLVERSTGYPPATRRPDRSNPTGKINGWKNFLNTLGSTYGDRLNIN
jgi:hypothetical protein